MFLNCQNQVINSQGFCQFLNIFSYYRLTYIRFNQSFQNSSKLQKYSEIAKFLLYRFDFRYPTVYPVNACFQHHQRLLRTAWKIEIISICIHLCRQYFYLAIQRNRCKPDFIYVSVRYLNTWVYLIEYIYTCTTTNIRIQSSPPPLSCNQRSYYFTIL